MAWATKTQTGTRHSDDCKMAFGRKDPNCPRCQELLAGDPPRAGWNDAAKAREAESIRALDAYCFCSTTPLYVNRCPRCGKPPYTD